MENLKRAANFNKAEEQLLISLVAKHQKIIECKKTDAVSSHAKDAQWKLLADEFNANSTTLRDHQTLRRKYENQKKKAKKAFSEEKFHMRGTGGGPPVSVKITETDLCIKELLNTQITGLNSEFDDDAEANVTYGEMADHNQSIEFAFDSDASGVVECSTASTSEPMSAICPTTWATYTPAMLRKPRSEGLLPSPLQHKKVIEEIRSLKRPSTEHEVHTSPINGSKRYKQQKTAAKWDLVADAKLELVEMQKQMLRAEITRKDEEHKMNMQQMKIEHQLKLKLLQLEIQIKEKQLGLNNESQL